MLLEIITVASSVVAVGSLAVPFLARRRKAPAVPALADDTEDPFPALLARWEAARAALEAPSGRPADGGAGAAYRDPAVDAAALQAELAATAVVFAPAALQEIWDLRTTVRLLHKEKQTSRWTVRVEGATVRCPTLRAAYKAGNRLEYHALVRALDEKD
jgi:hypothetical protein